MNARTSILAAANPRYGRYNENVPLHQNINLPYALLSRFDLLFLMLDTPDETGDELMAKHICHVHTTMKPPKSNVLLYDPSLIRSYIAYCKEKYNPYIPKHIQDIITRSYVKKRKEYKKASRTDDNYIYTTPRTLLGIIRLS